MKPTNAISCDVCTFGKKGICKTKFKNFLNSRKKIIGCGFGYSRLNSLVESKIPVEEFFIENGYNKNRVTQKIW